MYYDIHCHIFNKAIIDKRMDILLAPMFKLIDGFENKLPEKNLFELIEKGDNFLDAFMKMSSQEVFELLDSHYNNEFVLTPLMMDLEFTDNADLDKLETIRKRVWHDIALEFINLIRTRITAIQNAYPQLGSKMKSISSNNHFIWKEVLKPELLMFKQNNFQSQIDELENIAKQCNRVRPFLGIDARRSQKQNLVQLINEKILSDNALFAGVKLYAPTGFSPTHPALFDDNGVYQLCEKHGIPITVHNSSEGFSTQAGSVKINGIVNLNNRLVELNNEIVRFGIPFFSLRMRAAIKERAITLNHPKIWQKVFEKYPKLKLNLAHFGGKEELIKFVNSDIDIKKLTSNEFGLLLSQAEDKETRKLIEHCFLKKETRFQGKVIRVMYYLDKKLDLPVRKKLWDTLYHLDWLDNWSKAILDIITKYPNAYTDVSCFSSGKMIDGVFTIKEALTDFKVNVYDQLPVEVQNKILYGSDFFFVLLFGPTMANYINEFKEVFGAEFDHIASTNPERFLNITTF